MNSRGPQQLQTNVGSGTPPAQQQQTPQSQPQQQQQARVVQQQQQQQQEMRKPSGRYGDDEFGTFLATEEGNRSKIPPMNSRTDNSDSARPGDLTDPELLEPQQQSGRVALSVPKFTPECLRQSALGITLMAGLVLGCMALAGVFGTNIAWKWSVLGLATGAGMVGLARKNCDNRKWSSLAIGVGACTLIAVSIMGGLGRLSASKLGLSIVVTIPSMGLLYGAARNFELYQQRNKKLADSSANHGVSV
jgi:hypothetical protein